MIHGYQRRALRKTKSTMLWSAVGKRMLIARSTLRYWKSNACGAPHLTGGSTCRGFLERIPSSNLKDFLLSSKANEACRPCEKLFNLVVAADASIELRMDQQEHDNATTSVACRSILNTGKVINIWLERRDGKAHKT